MNLEELKCDILDILQNDDNMNILHEKCILSCREFRSCVAAKIKEKLLYEKDCDEKKSIKNEKVLELQQEIDTVQSDLDATMQQQKIIDKKINNATKLEESLKNELENSRAQRDDLSLEIVDLNEEHERKKKEKVLKWDALKRACNTYKLNLNMHIELKEEQDGQHVKISFFKYNKLTREYFTQLLFSNGQWSVEQIEPRLKKEHFNQLGVAMDCSEQSKILEITLFLCQLRSIFLQYYMNKKKTAHDEEGNCKSQCG